MNSPGSYSLQRVAGSSSEPWTLHTREGLPGPLIRGETRQRKTVTRGLSSDAETVCQLLSWHGKQWTTQNTGMEGIIKLSRKVVSEND